MLFDNLAFCFGSLLPEDLRSILSSFDSNKPFNPKFLVTQKEKTRSRCTRSTLKICPDLRAPGCKGVNVKPIDYANANILRLSGPYMQSMNRKIAPLASYADPEAQLPLDATHRDVPLKRKGDESFLDDEVLPDAKKGRATLTSPRNSSDSYSVALYKHDVDGVEIMKEPKNPTSSLLIKKRGNVRFHLPGAEMKTAQTKRSLIDLPGQEKSFGTFTLYNSAFAVTGSLPRVDDPLWFSELPECSWDNSDENEDSCQLTLVSTPSGSLDYSLDKPNTWVNYERNSSPTARLQAKLLLNPVLVPASDTDKLSRAIESEGSSDISSGSVAYSGSEEEEDEEEQLWTAISSEEEVQCQVEGISDFEGYRRGIGYERSASIVRGANVTQTKDREAVEVSRGIQRIRDRSPGELIRSLSCSEDGMNGLLKVSIKTLLEVGSGSFEGTLLKPNMAYRGQEINFSRHV